MSHNKAPQATLTTVARFPAKYFLENLAVRSDHSVLITSMNAKELWYVPPANQALPVEPVCLHTFEQPTTGLAEAEPDVFYLCTSNLYTTHESYVHRIDLRGWAPGAPIKPETALQFPAEARGLNGACMLAPGVLLVSDCFASLIWRVDLAPKAGRPEARVWLKHESMSYFPGELKPEQPGVNGVRFAAKTNFLYYTCRRSRTRRGRTHGR